MNIDCLILAGGRGTRVAHLLPEGSPKFLAPIKGRPFAEYQLDQIRSWNLGGFIWIASGHNSTEIFRWAIKREDIFVYYEPESAEEAVRQGGYHVTAPTTLVCNGDTLVNLDMQAMIEYRQTWPDYAVRAYVGGVSTGLMLLPSFWLPRFDSLPVLPFEARSFTDIGTPEVYKRIQDGDSRWIYPRPT